MRLLPLVLFTATGVFAQAVRVESDPFPTDRLTVPDDSRKTGRRVDLPLPACEGRAGDCSELAMINQFDGFNVQARVTIKFTAAIDPNTLRDGVFYLWLDPAWPRENLVRPAGDLTRINRVVWNPATRTMTAKPDDVLEQGRRYAIIVTDAVKDESGAAITAAGDFLSCTGSFVEDPYCIALGGAVRQAAQLLPERQVVSASIFTTMTGTAALESIREVARELPLNLRIGPTFDARELRSFVTVAHVRTEGERFQMIPFPAPVEFLPVFGVGRLTLGTLDSPRFLDSDMMLPHESPSVQYMEQIGFHVLLPATPMPPGGYPVLLAGHGLRDNRFAGPSVLAYSFMSQGYAILAINAIGHGYGPDTYLRIGAAAGVQDVPAPGRAVDLNNDGLIENAEGCILLSPSAPVSIRDCLRQTAVDWMTVVRAIQAGIDLDGDGQRDLSPGKMSYWGQSLGAFYGTLFMAMEPAVTNSILNVGGGSATETARLSLSLRPALRQLLASRQPSLLNVLPDFDEEYVERDQPAKVLSLPGAAELQDEFERLEWIEANGAPSTYAPHLTSAPRDGMPAKNMLFQFAIGDQTIPNPSNSLLARAAGAQQRTVVYRHDLASIDIPWLPADPHAYFAFLLEPGAFNIAHTVLQQAAQFSAGGGVTIPEVSPLVPQYFELPAILPEGTNFRKP
jgi:hypothetical protein